MASTQFAIKVTGLVEFQRAIKVVDADLPKALRVALNEAADAVVSRVRPRVASRSGKARGSVRARSTATKVRVTAGGKRALYYPWLDFGGKVGKSKSVKRQFRKYGRYLYPTYFELRAGGEFQQALSTALAGVVKQAGLEVT